MNRHADEDRIAGELSAIPGLTRGELIGLWEKAHGRPPPKGLSRRLLGYSAAYRVQAKAFGGSRWSDESCAPGRFPARERPNRHQLNAGPGPASCKGYG